MSSVADIDLLLQRYWGFDSFRPLQREIVEASVQGRDVLALLPTGGGKSLCYQMAGLARGGLTVVVSPLIALMADQQQALVARGLSATFINSTLPFDEQQRRLHEVRSGRVKFLYVAPERLMLESFRNELALLPVSLLAVDEAHCISQWGYDFRPAYRLIREFHARMPAVPLLAVTATATPEVQEDIVVQLGLRQPSVFAASFERPNLRFGVVQTPDRHAALYRFLGRYKGSAIVYVRTRATAESLAEAIRAAGISAQAYHAGLSGWERQRVQDAWLNDATRVVVATNAFGMGIDKADVRLVVHWNMPGNLESYYQEAGRAGRDGLTAVAALLFDPQEAERQEQMMAQNYPDWPTVQQVISGLYDFSGVGSLPPDPQRPIGCVPSEWAERMQVPPASFDAVLKLLEAAGAVKIVRGDDRSGSHPEVSIRDLSAIREHLARLPDATRDLLELVLRRTGGSEFSEPLKVEEAVWAQQLGIPTHGVGQRLRYLAQQGFIRYTHAGEWKLYFQRRKDELNRQLLDWDALERRKEGAGIRLSRMSEYAETTTQCRQVLIRQYFGESRPDPCGVCDVCTHTRQSGVGDADVAAAILTVLEAAPRGYAGLLESLAIGSGEQRVRVLRALADEGRVRISKDFRVSLSKP